MVEHLQVQCALKLYAALVASRIVAVGGKTYSGYTTPNLYQEEYHSNLMGMVGISRL
jgi:hypothetical protein